MVLRSHSRETAAPRPEAEIRPGIINLAEISLPEVTEETSSQYTARSMIPEVEINAVEEVVLTPSGQAALPNPGPGE